jgi:hypothetical protein
MLIFRKRKQTENFIGTGAPHMMDAKPIGKGNAKINGP